MPVGVDVTTFVGLDVHARSVVASTIDGGSGEVWTGQLASARTDDVVAWVAARGARVAATYEAGPTGFGLARGLTAAGVRCVVAAPGKIPRAPQDRVKTDRRDAERLARLLVVGQIPPVEVPPVAVEGLRDLTRCWGDLRGEVMAVRHRISKLCLRHDLRYAGATNWTGLHRTWLGQQRFDAPLAQDAMWSYLAGYDALVARQQALRARIVAAAQDGPWAEAIGRLRCLRGVDWITAAVLIGEVHTFDRFPNGRSVMSYFGLVASEHSSGPRTVRGPITKTGSTEARRVLVEAVIAYQNRPAIAKALRDRQDGQPAWAVQHSWRCQTRLHRHYVDLKARGLPHNKVRIAIARELAGFCWAIGRTPDRE